MHRGNGHTRDDDLHFINHSTADTSGVNGLLRARKAGTSQQASERNTCANRKHDSSKPKATDDARTSGV
jgi:hypothetical protein